MPINLSIILRIIGLIVAVGTYFIQLGQIFSALIFGVFIGILAWSIFDLIFGFFQDRPTQGINSGISLISTIIPLPYFQYTGTPMLLLGVVIGLVIAVILDWKTKGE